MGAVLKFEAQLETGHPCINCGVMFAMPSTLLQQRRDDGGTFYCPNGHPQSYTETTVKRLEREFAATKKRAEEMVAAELRRRVSAEQDMERAQRSAAATRGEITKLKNRVGNGVCPCCRRSFQNLQRHMKTKHPAFKDEGAES